MIEGKKIVDISELLEVFEAQEGAIESWSGKIGNGKTYGAVRRAIRDLQKGRVVYTNFRMNLDNVVADQRKSLPHAFFNFLFFRKRFYNIDIKKNWHYYDLDDPGIVDFIASLTDCIVYADEGQDIFDSYEGTKMSKKKRKSLTRTRHLNKTLVIISQRPQAIAVTARANVNVFYRCVKAWSWPFLYFKVYATEEVDAQNMPIWENEEYLHESYFGSNEIYNAYNTHELRAGIPKSQEVHFEAYELNFIERLKLLLSFAQFPSFRKETGKKKSLGVKEDFATIKKGERLNTVPLGGKKYSFSDLDKALETDTLPF